MKPAKTLLKKWRTGKKNRQVPVDYELVIPEKLGEQKHRIVNMSFAGMTLMEYALKPGTKLWTQCYALKKFIKNLPGIGSQITPAVKDIDIAHYHSKSIQEIKNLVLEDMIVNNAEIKQKHKEIDDTWEWHADHYVDWTEKIFDVLTVIVESDNYPRGQWFRFIKAVNTWIKANEHIHGPDFMNELTAMHNRDTALLIEAYKGGKG